MPRHHRIESSQETYLITTRTIESRLWLVNNAKLHERICAFLARYREMYQIKLHAFVIMGNHYHLVARFPQTNRKKFMSSFNGMLAKLVASHSPTFTQGKLWGCRYSAQCLPHHEDIERAVLYCALNPVSTGLVALPNQYNTYNSFTLASHHHRREHTIFLREQYNQAVRQRVSKVDPAEFTVTHTLAYDRIPGYEELSDSQYTARLLQRHTEQHESILAARSEAGQTFPPLSSLKTIHTGATPRATKTTDRNGHHPLVISNCALARQLYIEHYLECRAQYIEASARYRAGDFTAPFPAGMHRPPVHPPPN
jgi:putative transposase